MMGPFISIMLIETHMVIFLFADDGALYFDNVNRNSHGNIKDEMKLICEWLRIN